MRCDAHDPKGQCSQIDKIDRHHAHPRMGQRWKKELQCDIDYSDAIGSGEPPRTANGWIGRCDHRKCHRKQRRNEHVDAEDENGGHERSQSVTSKCECLVKRALGFDGINDHALGNNSVE